MSIDDENGLYDLSAITDRIAFFMRMTGVKQSQLHEKSGLSRNFISQVLQKKRKPNLLIVMAIASIDDDISLRWLLFGDGDMHQSHKATTISNDAQERIKTVANLMESMAKILNQESKELIL